MNYIPKKTLARGVVLFFIGVGCVFNFSQITKYQEDLQKRQSEAAQTKTNENTEESRINQANSDSELAMARVRSGCVPVILTQNNKPVRFNNTLRVFDAQTFPTNPKIPRFDKAGNPINGVQPLPQGITVCNEFGDTALVGPDGYITKIYRVEQSKLQEFQGYLKK